MVPKAVISCHWKLMISLWGRNTTRVGTIQDPFPNITLLHASGKAGLTHSLDGRRKGWGDCLFSFRPQRTSIWRWPWLLHSSLAFHPILFGHEHTHTSIKLNREPSLPTEYECSPLRNKVFSDKKKKMSALFNRHNELGKVHSKYRLIPKNSGGIEYRLGNRL